MPTNQKFTLPRFKAGQPLLEQITASRPNGILDAIDRCGVIFGKNITGTRTSGGAIIRAKFNPATSGLNLNCSFLMSDATTTVDEIVVNKVLVADGKVNGVLPTGMGAGDYTLTIGTPEDALILVAVTFDPDTLSITARSLEVVAAADFPDNEIDEFNVGHVYFMIGFTYVDPDAGFTIYQTWLGDLNFQLIYGSLNAEPALFPVLGLEPFLVPPPA
jgi:hypothetical protein